MIKFYPLLLVVLSSCGSHLNYLGSSYTPTKKVDVYVEASAIRRPYTIIGKGYMEYGVGSYSLSAVDRMQKKAVEKAKAKGADAVLFQEYYFRDHTVIQTVSRPDSTAGSLIQSGNLTAAIGTRTTILFLRYD